MATSASTKSYFALKLPVLKFKEPTAAADVRLPKTTPTIEVHRRALPNNSVPAVDRRTAESSVKEPEREQPKIPMLKKTKSEGNMRRTFSFKRSRSAFQIPRVDKSEPMPAFHERGSSFTLDEKQKHLLDISNVPNGGLQRSKSRRVRFAKAIANPDEMFARDPESPPPESKFNISMNSKFVRTSFGAGIDFGCRAPQGPITPPTPLPDLDAPLFSQTLVSSKVARDLARENTIRPLCRSDYHRGFMDLMGVLGTTSSVSEEAWEERCSWLETMGSTYCILVITAPNLKGRDERIVASGTIFFERKFTHDLRTVGHIEDIAVARDQKGKKMGLRMLEALVFAAQAKGCCKTLVHCMEGNEDFHAQCGFSKNGA